MKFLITGATGKVGAALMERILASAALADARIVALCHNRTPTPHPRVEIVRGSVGDPQVVAKAMAGVTHVVHLATTKEDPDTVVDVTIKGLFLLLEEARKSASLRQFVLVGGDAAVGHCVVEHKEPITEATPLHAYPGVYAFSKAIEEVMVEQYRLQYGLRTTIVRAPWIMEKDDFKYALSLGPDQFGGPSWDDYLSSADRSRYAAENRVPVLLDIYGRPLLRNFVHVSDLVEAMIAVIDNDGAIGELFNIAMTNPVNYGEVGAILSRTRGLQPVEIKTSSFSNILSNAKARLRLRWQPRYELAELIEAAFTYERRPDDPRKVWYIG